MNMKTTSTLLFNFVGLFGGRMLDKFCQSCLMPKYSGMFTASTEMDGSILLKSPNWVDGQSDK